MEASGYVQTTLLGMYGYIRNNREGAGKEGLGEWQTERIICRISPVTLSKNDWSGLGHMVLSHLGYLRPKGICAQRVSARKGYLPFTRD